MDELVLKLKKTLDDSGASHKGKRRFLPNVDRLEQAVENLLDVMFPGFRCQFDSFEGESKTCPVEQTLRSVYADLVQEVAKVFAHQRFDTSFSQSKNLPESFVADPSSRSASRPLKAEDLDQAQTLAKYKEEAASVVSEFLEHIPSIQAILQTDAQAAYDGDPACNDLDEVVLCYPGFFAIATYRLSHLLHQMKVPLIPRIISEWSHRKTGIDIHPGASIGKEFFIDHGTGVVIGETCRIGDGVKVYQGVTLGALSFPKDGDGKLRRDTIRHPKIEDNVVLYANSTVLGGNTTIGKGAVIGSSAWITESVAPGHVVVMDSPKLKVRSQLPVHFVNNYHI